MYQRVTTSSGKRTLKKLPVGVRRELIASTRVLETNPYAGEKLSGSLHFLYSFHFKVRNNNYRAVYTIDSMHRQIIFHFVGSRENFYEKLRRLFD